MVFQLDTRMPLAYRGFDYGDTQRNALAQMQMRQAREEAEQNNALAAAYRQDAPALLGGDASAQLAAAGRIAALGPRGFQMVAPIAQGARERQEYDEYVRGRSAPGRAGAVAMPQGAPAATPASMPAGAANPQWSDRSLPRGIRNNNPLNLSFVAGQPGVQGSDGRFGRYNTPEEGVAAATRQLQLYGQRGVNTLEGIISRWAPPNENNTAAYIQRVAAATGLDPRAPVDLSNPEIVSRMVAAMAQHENGRPVPMDVVQRGVTMALTGGARPAGGGDTVPANNTIPAAGGAAAGQRVDVDPGDLARLQADLAHPNPMIRRDAQARLAVLQFQRQNAASGGASYREETRTIGGRQVTGQVNAQTGQFTPYPGQTGAERNAQVTPATARADVLELGPRVAAGDIRPGTPEYDRYEMAYRLATAPTQVWVDDPNNPGTQRLTQVPGMQLNPARFPPPEAGTYGGGGGVPAPAQGTPAAGAAAPAPSAPAQPGAAPADATDANPAGITRQAPGNTPTGEENLSAGYARRMVEAEGLLDRAIQQGYAPGNIRDAAGVAIGGARNAGPISRFVGNSVMSEQGQLYRQAQEDWVRAKLRRESGAVIGEEEMAREIQVYFPQPGDSAAVIAQKAQARQVAIQAMRQAAGRASQSVPRAASPGPGGRGTAEPPPPAPRRAAPAPGAVEDGYRFRGGDPSSPSNWERVQ